MQWLYWLGTYQSGNILEAAEKLFKQVDRYFKKNFFNGIFY